MATIAGAILSGLLALAAVWQQQNGFPSDVTAAAVLVAFMLTAAAGMSAVVFRDRELKLAERELALKEREFDDEQFGAKLQDVFNQVASMDDFTAVHYQGLADHLGVSVPTATVLHNLMSLRQPSSTT